MDRCRVGRLLGLALALAAGGVAAGADEAQVVALKPAVLEDPEVVPPTVRRPALAVLGNRCWPSPSGDLRVDLDHDGTTETTLPRGRAPRLLWMGAAGAQSPFLVLHRAVGGEWEATPAGLLRGRPGKHVVEVLDADGDGDFAQATDLVRWADGPFHPHPRSRRLGSATGAAAYELRRDGKEWSLRLVPEPRPSDATDAAWRGLLAVGEFRNRVGLPPLTLDAARSDGCRRHAEYIRLNPTDGFGHQELEGRPGFSPEGRTAAEQGVMERTADPAFAVERLTRMMLHRTPFLGSEDQPLGVGVSSPTAGAGLSSGRMGTGFTVLWAGEAMRTDTFPILVPGPGARDVPTEMLEELPPPEAPPGFYDEPRGYPVSIGFLRSGARVRLELFNEATGKAVAGEVYAPERPVHTSFAHNYRTAFFAPTAPLARGSAYVARATLVDAGGEALDRYVWTFRTVK